jgi:SAM-dependent methyltransferase
VSESARLADVRAAFDSVAGMYDGPAGNNAVVQWMRLRLIRTVKALAPPGSDLLDLGCGTGIDVADLAASGYRVLGVDWSPQMIAAARHRIGVAGAGERARAQTLGMHELDRLEERFDLIFSNLGAINCAPSLEDISAQCHRLLRPGGHLVLSVIGRFCPWEVMYYLARRQPRRAFVRWTGGVIPVPLNGLTVWTRYYTPRELYSHLAEAFERPRYEALGFFAPPPYLLGVWDRFPRLRRMATRLDERIGDWPVLRSAGDSFLITLARRDERTL